MTALAPGGSMTTHVTILNWLPDGTIQEYSRLSDLPDTRPGVLWVDIQGQTEELLEELGRTMHFHELALEDSLRSGEPPKVEEYEDHIFLIVAVPEHSPQGIVKRKVSFFLGETFLVTIHRTPQPVIEDLLGKARKMPGRVMGRGLDFLAYRIADTLCDRFLFVMEEYGHLLDKLEERALLDPGHEVIAALTDIKHEIAHIDTIANMQTDVMLQITRGNYEMFGDNARKYFRDIYDHMLKVQHYVTIHREGIKGVRDAFFSASNGQLNESMRMLTLVATCAVPMNLIAGIFGMNFGTMPLTQHPYGFWLALCLMAGAFGSFLYYYRRRGWL